MFSIRSLRRGTLAYQLEQARIRFDLVTGCSNDGLWDMVHSSDGQIGPQSEVTWSARFRELLGYRTESEFPNVFASWTALLHPDHAAETRDIFVRHVQDRTSRDRYDVEYRLRTRSRGYRWFRARSTTLRDSAGKPIRTAGSLTDITDEGSRSEESAAALVRAKLISASTTEGLWDMEYPKDGKLLPDTPFWWSDHFRHLLGYSNVNDFPDLLKSWASLLHPDDEARTLTAFGDHLTDLTGRTPYNVQYRLKTRSGKYRWFHACGTTLRDAAGHPLRVAGSLIDIDADKLREADLERALAQEVTSFDAIAASVAKLLAAAGDMNSTSEKLSLNARQTSATVASTADSADKIVQNAQSVAAAIDQLSATITDIAKNVTNATRVAQSAVATAQETNTTIKKLDEGSRHINDIIRVIESIADQTNLLALNAAIEAARAGEHGRGFAVVSDEVRKLATESQHAIKDINDKVQTMQTGITASIAAIGRISAVINEISGIQGSIATAVEEQAAATRSIAGISSETAQGSRQIAKSVAAVIEMSNQSLAISTGVQGCSAELSTISRELGLIAHA
jgi:PAS domain S-box-containing protein